MAGITGPTRNLPGTKCRVPDGATCDTEECNNRIATYRITGEVDSFGSEQIDMCTECYTKYIKYVMNEDTSGNCDWCKSHSPKLYKRRDIDEGFTGRIYNVCAACIKKENEDLDRELEHLNKAGSWR